VRTGEVPGEPTEITLHVQGAITMKLSTRNVLKGKVVDLQEGMVAAKVKVDIGAGNTITATVTVEAVKELGIKVGDEINVLIKASSVMLGKE
jgi:molybdopterin-binding protein